MKRLFRTLYLTIAAVSMLGTTACTSLLTPGYDYSDYYDSYYYQTGGIYNPGARPPYGSSTPPPPPPTTRPTPPPSAPATRPTPSRPAPGQPSTPGNRPGQNVTPSRPSGSGNASNSGHTRPKTSNEPAQNSGRTR